MTVPSAIPTSTSCDAVGRLFRNTTEWFPEGQKNAAAGEASKVDIANCLRFIDEALAGKDFLVGDYTLADTHLNSFTDWLRHMHIDFAPFERLNGWSKRCSERPAYLKAMAE